MPEGIYTIRDDYDQNVENQNRPPGAYVLNVLMTGTAPKTGQSKFVSGYFGWL